MAHDRTKLAAERINPEGNIPTILPVVPLRDIVVFPYMTSPVLLGRESSLKAVTSAVEHHKYIFLTAQKNAELEDPTKDDIFHDGTVAKIIQMVKLPNGLIKIVTEGVTQASIVSFAGNAEFLEAQIKLSSSGHALTPEIDALIRQVSSLFAEYTQLNRALSKDILASVEAINDPHRKLFTMAASILQASR
jgi:ATP-dependent Lon protease